MGSNTANVYIYVYRCSIQPITHHPTHPHIHPSTHLSANPPTHPSTHPPTYPSTYPFTYSSTHPSTHLPTHTPLAQEKLITCCPATYKFPHSPCTDYLSWPGTPPAGPTPRSALETTDNPSNPIASASRIRHNFHPPHPKCSTPLWPPMQTHVGGCFSRPAPF